VPDFGDGTAEREPAERGYGLRRSDVVAAASGSGQQPVSSLKTCSFATTWLSNDKQIVPSGRHHRACFDEGDVTMSALENP
jgi:hypothetical protein